MVMQYNTLQTLFQQSFFELKKILIQFYIYQFINAAFMANFQLFDFQQKQKFYFTM